MSSHCLGQLDVPLAAGKAPLALFHHVMKTEWSLEARLECHPVRLCHVMKTEWSLETRLKCHPVCLCHVVKTEWSLEARLECHLVRLCLLHFNYDRLVPSREEFGK